MGNQDTGTKQGFWNPGYSPPRQMDPSGKSSDHRVRSNTISCGSSINKPRAGSPPPPQPKPRRTMSISCEKYQKRKPIARPRASPPLIVLKESDLPSSSVELLTPTVIPVSHISSGELLTPTKCSTSPKVKRSSSELLRSPEDPSSFVLNILSNVSSTPLLQRSPPSPSSPSLETSHLSSSLLEEKSSSLSLSPVPARSRPTAAVSKSSLGPNKSRASSVSSATSSSNLINRSITSSIQCEETYSKPLSPSPPRRPRSGSVSSVSTYSTPYPSSSSSSISSSSSRRSRTNSSSFNSTPLQVTGTPPRPRTSSVSSTSSSKFTFRSRASSSSSSSSSSTISSTTSPPTSPNYLSTSSEEFWNQYKRQAGSDSVLTKLLKKALIKKALSSPPIRAPLSPDSGVEEDCDNTRELEAIESVYSEIYRVQTQPPLPVKSSTLRPPARPPYSASAAIAKNNERTIRT